MITVVFRDSLKMFQAKLSELPKMFNLTINKEVVFYNYMQTDMVIGNIKDAYNSMKPYSEDQA
jgi:hypothetical protein